MKVIEIENKSYLLIKNVLIADFESFKYLNSSINKSKYNYRVVIFCNREFLNEKIEEFLLKSPQSENSRI